jgi:hypothetical protein
MKSPVRWWIPCETPPLSHGRPGWRAARSSILPCPNGGGSDVRRVTLNATAAPRPGLNPSGPIPTSRGRRPPAAPRR